MFLIVCLFVILDDCLRFRCVCLIVVFVCVWCFRDEMVIVFNSGMYWFVVDCLRVALFVNYVCLFGYFAWLVLWCCFTEVGFDVGEVVWHLALI